jgi:hypothetical protein
MFGAARVAGRIYTIASSTPAVTSLVGDRIYRSFAPQMEGGLQVPFLVYRMPEPATDDGPMGVRRVTAQQVRYEIALYTEGPQVAPLIPAMEALHSALHASNVTENGYQITCRREYELQDLDPEFGMYFVRVGGLYIFDVSMLTTVS